MLYDPTYLPFISALTKAETGEGPRVTLVVRRGQSLVYPYSTRLPTKKAERYPYLRALTQLLLWMVGGDSLSWIGDETEYLAFVSRAKTDPECLPTFQEMSRIFHTSFSFQKEDTIPAPKGLNIGASGSFEGCRIGIDLGGSDRKVTATIDGNVVFSDETLWLPKEQKDWHYHYQGILDSLEKAKQHLPRIDAVGISTAGVVIDNRFAEAALCFSVPLEKQRKEVRDLFLTLQQKEFPDVPMLVANDGDVTAFGGATLFHQNHLLGLAMGTGEATGYFADGHFNGWILELGKAPFRFDDAAKAHYAVHTKGAGTEYLSQKGLLRLAKEAGYIYEGTLAEQLLAFQKEAATEDQRWSECYREMGVYLADAISLYAHFLPLESVLVLGRVTSGKGGDLMIQVANQQLQHSSHPVKVFSADESFKRLGQSYFAAALPKSKA